MRSSSRGVGVQQKKLLMVAAVVAVGYFGYTWLQNHRRASWYVEKPIDESEYSDVFHVKLHEDICSTSVRAGSSAGEDGGWDVCKPLKKPCIVYSYGIKDDFSFDKHMAKVEACEVHGFDPSPYGLPSAPRYNKAGGIYHDVGLGGIDGTFKPGTAPFLWPGLGYLSESNTAPWVLERIPTTMNKLNHNHVTVLKIDVEGAEWFVIDQLLSSSWDQLMMELHFPPDEYELMYRSDGFTAGLVKEKTINRIELLRKLSTVATLWKWNFNQSDKNCVEVYFLRNQQQ